MGMRDRGEIGHGTHADTRASEKGGREGETGNLTSVLLGGCVLHGRGHRVSGVFGRIAVWGFIC